MAQEYITDPALLDALNGGDTKPKREKITNKSTLAELDAPPERSGLKQAQHVGEAVVARPAMQGVAGGVLGFPALIADSVMGVGRDLAYGGKMALSTTGAVEPPDPRNYYGDGSAFPAVDAAAAAGAALPDALNLDRPETATERVGSAVVEGGTSALTGVGLGSLLARVPGAVGSIGRFLGGNPVAQTASGMAGGGAAQGVVEMGGDAPTAATAGFVAGMLPGAAGRTGRTTVASEAGQRAAAGSILRRTLRDKAAALRNLDTVGDRTRIADFRHMSSDAAQDLGLASAAPKIRDWANQYDAGAVADVKHHNSRILSRYLDLQGAAPGTADRTRATQQAVDRTRIENLDLAALPPADVTGLMDEMERGTNIRRTGQREDVGDAHREMLARMQRGAIPQRDARGNLVAWEMPLPNLQAARTDFSAARRPTSTSPTLPSLRNARRETQPFMTQIDAELNSATNGDYADYLAESRRVRTIADNQEFMEDFGHKVNPSGGRLPDGSRVIDSGPWIAQVNNKADKPVAGGNRAMSVERLSPLRRQFLEDATADLNDARFAQGVGTIGSNTALKQDIGEMVGQEVQRGRGPIAKIAEPALKAIGLSANTAAKIITPVAGAVGRGLSTFGSELADRGVSAAEENVRRILGRAEANPALMAQLIRTAPAYNPGVAMTAAGKAVKMMRGGAQGFLAGDRTARYR